MNKPKMLIMCHGRKHNIKYENAITLDINYGCNPDICIHMTIRKYWKIHPDKFYDHIRFEYAPIYTLQNSYTIESIFEFWKLVISKLKNKSILSFTTIPPFCQLKIISNILRNRNNNIDVLYGKKIKNMKNCFIE